MSILAGILFFAAALATFFAFVMDGGVVLLLHITKLIVGIVAIVILFSIGCPVWMYIVSILSVSLGFIGGCVGMADEPLVGGFMIIGGLAGKVIVGAALLFF